MVREFNKRNWCSNKGRADRTTRQLHQASTMRLYCAPVSADPPVRPLMHELSAVTRIFQLHGKTSQHQSTHWYTRFIRYIALPSFLSFTCTWFANLISEIGVPTKVEQVAQLANYTKRVLCDYIVHQCPRTHQSDP
ncbi:hypothetical protein WA026_007571 [Henosepilachna vigintioctopunctata]|uniref:Uncharacterized protein n=1 Tax=Henosepilachna vigintioctopunctata TaxID=420089 RepID=A0AAW1UM96_9CUCU